VLPREGGFPYHTRRGSSAVPCSPSPQTPRRLCSCSPQEFSDALGALSRT